MSKWTEDALRTPIFLPIQATGRCCIQKQMLLQGHWKSNAGKKMNGDKWHLSVCVVIITNSHTEQTWVYETSIYPLPLLSPFSPCCVPLFLPNTQVETWIKDDRYIAVQRAGTKSRTGEVKHGGKTERECEETSLAWHGFVFRVTTNTVYKNQPVMFYWADKICYLQPSHLGQETEETHKKIKRKKKKNTHIFLSLVSLSLLPNNDVMWQVNARHNFTSWQSFLCCSAQTEHQSFSL